jgi:predicted ATPase/DNA-binding CsgD family transcriptional regulator
MPGKAPHVSGGDVRWSDPKWIAKRNLPFHPGRRVPMNAQSNVAEAEQPNLLLINFGKEDRPSGLPSLPNRLIGRDAEIGQVRELLARNRLVTLTGPGGIGKTRLAIEAARASSGDFADGVVFVSLAPVRDLSLVVPTIAQTMGLPNAGSIATAEELASRLGERRQLLVLDNLEQVIERGPEIATILTFCPNIKALTTSRTVLRVQAERVYVVTPLSLPPTGQAGRVEDLANSAAVELFVERAQSFDSNFNLNDGNSADVADICRRLDGLPLAIELSAARIRMLSPAQILARIEWRLPLLTGGPRDAPARQQTLRDTLAWSYNLLSASEQEIFRRLSVFVGGFTLEAARAVSAQASEVANEGSTPANVFDVISTLTDHSLVRKIEQGDEPRFGMLETIREYGLELLGSHSELDATRRKHAEWVAEFVERIRPGIEGPNGTAVLDQYEREHPNVRAALAHAVETGDGELGCRIVTLVATFWMMRTHYREGLTWSERVLALPGDVPMRLRLEALYAAADFATDVQDFGLALKRTEEGRSLARTVKDEPLEAKMVFLLGVIEYARGRVDEAAKHYDKAIDLSRRKGTRDAINSQVRAFMRTGRAEVAVAQDDLELGKSVIEEADEIFRASGDTWGLAISRESMATIAMLQGDFSDAVAGYRQSLTDYRQVGDRSGFANCLTGLAIVATLIGDYTSAVRLFSAAEEIRTQAGGLIAPMMKASRDHALAATKTHLGSRRFDAAWQAGIDLSLEQVFTEAIGLSLDQPQKQETSFGLTPRQLEVLRLMAEGRTDREIADELFISYRTVTSHVQNILNQMGVDSRTTASTDAMRLGLI